MRRGEMSAKNIQFHVVPKKLTLIGNINVTRIIEIWILNQVGAQLKAKGQNNCTNNAFKLLIITLCGQIP